MEKGLRRALLTQGVGYNYEKEYFFSRCQFYSARRRVKFWGL